MLRRIERLWKELKDGVARALLLHGKLGTAAEFHRLIRQVLGGVSAERQRRASLLNNRRYIKGLLEQVSNPEAGAE